MTESGEAGPIVPSRVESERFGLQIGRWTPDEADEVSRTDPSELDRYDIVIVRQPASWSDRWSDLARFDGHVPLHADTLVYWAWNDDGADLPTVRGNVRQHRGAAGVDDLVRDVFADYQNHYTSNPLLDRGAALEGYVEWARRTCEAVDGYLTVDDSDGPIGFAVVDWTEDPPDVRLAGMCRRARGAGRYRDLVTAMLQTARSRNHAGVCISTQARNIAVQRTWAASGLRPMTAIDTTHLVRSDLFAATATSRGPR